MFKTRKFGIPWLDIAVDIAFSSARNWDEGSIFPVAPFRFNQLRQNASRSSICQLYSPSKFFQNVRIICPNNTFCYIYNLSSVDHTTSLTCSYYNVLNFFDFPTFLKTKWSPSVLYLFFQLLTEVLVNVNSGYFTENFLIAHKVANVNAWFPMSVLTFWGSFIWYLFGLPWDLSISFTANLNSAFCLSKGDNFSDGYFFSFLSIFIFFKKIVKKLLFVHFANWSSPMLKQQESENIKTSKLNLILECLQKHSIWNFIETAILIVLKST